MTTDTIGTGEERSAGAGRGLADGLCLAAAPTFALMALLTGALGGGVQDPICSAAQHASPLIGMVPMYLLMSAVHSAPWLRLIARVSKSDDEALRELRHHYASDRPTRRKLSARNWSRAPLS